MTTAAALVTVTATSTSEYLPANRLAVAPAVFARLCRESAACGGNLGAPDQLHITADSDDAAELDAPDQLHITADSDDAAELDALDDLLRDRAQTVGEFVGAECFALFTGQGIDGCNVWARCKVEEIAEPQTVAEVIG